MSAIIQYYTMLRLEFLSIWRGQLYTVQSLIFFMISILIFPLAVGSNLKLLTDIAPGYIWMMAIFASLLALEGIFKLDYQSGFLEKCLTSPDSLLYYCYSKVIAHWILHGLPLVVAAPILGSFYHLPMTALSTLFVSLAIGTLSLSLFATLAAVLTLPIEQQSLLTPLLVTPLMAPVIILGTLATYDAVQGISPLAMLWLLLAILSIAIVGLPLATRYLLRVGTG